MGTIAQGLKYFLKRNRKIRGVPHQYINADDDIRRASRDETMLIKAGYARTAGEARRLLAGERAIHYIRTHPLPPRGSTIKQRFINWVMRLQGAQPGNPHKIHNLVSHLPKSYRYRHE